MMPFSFTLSHSDLTRLVANKNQDYVRRKVGATVGNECLVGNEILTT